MSEEHPTLERLLDRLDQGQTQQLIQALVAEQPDLLEAIARHVTSLTTSTFPFPPSISNHQQMTVDPVPFRQRVQQILQEAVRYFEAGWEGDPITESLLEIIHEAQEYTERGDGNGAIAILDAITQACAEGWDEVADYGADIDEIADALDQVWTEAILTADLTPEEQADLRISLETWEDELDVDFVRSLEEL